MKKTIILALSIMLFTGLSFAQTPQTQDKDKNAKPATQKECTHKETKSSADKKDSKSCPSTCVHAKDSKSPCPHSTSSKSSTTTTPKHDKK